jgi:Flp pilus assembly protein TadD
LTGARRWRLMPRPMTLRRHLSYAQGYLELGLVAEAAAELARIHPPHTAALDFIVVKMAVLQEQKAWPELAAVAAEVVRRVPDEAGGWVTWAYATRRADTLAAAERILLDAEKQHPDDATIQFNLGCYACVRGDLKAARRRVQRAIALDPKFEQAAAADSDLEALRANKGRELDI